MTLKCVSVCAQEDQLIHLWAAVSMKGWNLGLMAGEKNGFMSLCVFVCVWASRSVAIGRVPRTQHKHTHGETEKEKTEESVIDWESN